MSEITLTQHRISVLLVDDQDLIGETVRRMLSTEEDIDFHYCRDPLQAIKTANRILPTVILQDLVMPEIDGLTLVRYFRANKATRDVPLIVLSSREEALTKAEAFALGANDYMVKFPDPLEVIARIRYHSKGYINLLQRNEAYEALLESQKKLEIRNHFIRQTFGRYLSDEIVDSVLEYPEGMKLGGEKRKVTIMMSDLRGFTAMTEQLPAESVVGIINIYLETMTDIILKYNGTIDEFIGDGILVIFGAPIERENDAVRAVACALEMQSAMEKMNQRNREAGYPAVAMGIGINTGEVIVGNIGSKKRTKYAVVGRNVNLASRIESYTVGGQILIAASTLEACGPILRIDDQMEVMPKGVKAPIPIYQIGGMDGSYNIHLPLKEKIKLSDLEQSLKIKFSVLSGKHEGTDSYGGSIVRMAEDAAEIHSQIIPDRLENLKISLFDKQGAEVTSDLYGKVTECKAIPAPSFTVSFTSVSPEAKSFLQETLSSCLKG